MSQGFRLSRREALLGGGVAALGAASWLGRGWILGCGDRDSQALAALERQAKPLNWRDLRPETPEAEAAALLARIKARRRGELGPPPSVGAPEPTIARGRRLGGVRSHESAVALDWVDGAALDTSPAADAPYVWGTGQKPRPEDLVGSLDARLVSLPGYALPLDGGLENVTRFLLAPYVGACIHVPPPPANQIVLVSSETPYRFGELFEPILVVGEMRVEPASSPLAEVGYQLQAALVRRFDPERDAYN